MKKLLLSAMVLFPVVFGNMVCRADEIGYKENRISGPYAHRNLAVFLIHGKSTVDSSDLLTLDEAIEKNLVVIHETENVSELRIENKSDKRVFIQSGDIVKGGKQDRVLRHDLVLQPKSGKLPVASFCVEQERWSKRGNENLDSFSSSKKQLASKKLKLAAKQRESQRDVWSEVANVQEKLSKNMGKSVKSSRSRSSLQLTLEDKDIEKLVKEYRENISKMTAGKEDVIGFAFAINGEINSSDVYGSSALFRKLWPKMLEGCAAEAISELQEGKKARELTAKDLVQWLDEADRGEETDKPANKQTRIKVKESKKDIVFETYHNARNDAWIHKNVIRK